MLLDKFIVADWGVGSALGPGSTLDPTAVLLQLVFYSYLLLYK